MLSLKPISVIARFSAPKSFEAEKIIARRFVHRITTFGGALCCCLPLSMAIFRKCLLIRVPWTPNNSLAGEEGEKFFISNLSKHLLEPKTNRQRNGSFRKVSNPFLASFLASLKSLKRDLTTYIFWGETRWGNQTPKTATVSEVITIPLPSHNRNKE